MERLDSGLRACAAGGGQVIYRPRYQEKCQISEVHDIGILPYWIHIGNDIEVFWVPISVYSDIFCNIGIRDHIGHDIGEKPDIGFGKERVCPDIDPIS